MITPRWLSTPTQPIDIDDVVSYLAAAPFVDASAGREVQIGCPDVLAYAAMLDRMAVALGKRPRPKIPVPLLTPRLSSLWIGLVTPVDARVARPLIEGLSTETVVTDPSGAALFDVEPIGFDASLRKAVASEQLRERAAGGADRDRRAVTGSRWRIAPGRVIMAAHAGPLDRRDARRDRRDASRIASSTAGGAAGSAQVRERAAAWGVAQNGLHEVGTSNCGPQINRWQRQMGLKVPPCRVWCGAFVHQAFRQAGVQLSHRLIDPHLLLRRRDRRAQRPAQDRVGDIQRGDIVFYNFREDEGLKASHLAIARDRPRGSKLATAEGNTSHAVRLEVRSLKYIVLAARVTGDA